MHEVTRVSQRLGDRQKSRPRLRDQKWKVLFPGNSRDGGVGYCKRILRTSSTGIGEKRRVCVRHRHLPRFTINNGGTINLHNYGRYSVAIAPRAAEASGGGIGVTPRPRGGAKIIAQALISPFFGT